MAVAPARTTERRTVGDVLARDLVYVTGKGGAGKTTVAAALALAAAATGRRALVCEVGGAQALADAFPGAEFSIDAHEALLDWMRAQPGGAIAAATLGHSRAFTRFVEAAPGAKELVTIGKAVDLAQAPRHDLVPPSAINRRSLRESPDVRRAGERQHPEVRWPSSRPMS